MVSQFFGVWGTNSTTKLATAHPWSPLLRARPDFLCVALSGDYISIFKELLLISDLSKILNFNLKSCIKEIDEADIDDEIESALSDTNVELEHDHPSVRHKEQPSADNALTDKVETDDGVIFVVDRSPDGSTLVPYSHKSTTLKLFELLKEMKIPFETEIYKPKEERLFMDSDVFYCKNLFLKDRKGQFYLVICHEDLNMDLKQLRKSLNAYRNFNFGTAEDMATLLGTQPGGVTPFALMNPNSVNVKMVVHKSLMKEDAWLMFHPFDLNLATKITLPSLMRFLKTFSHDVNFLK